MHRVSDLLALIANGILVAGAVATLISVVVGLWSGSLVAGLAVALGFSVALNLFLGLSYWRLQNGSDASVLAAASQQNRAELDALRSALSEAMAQAHLDREGKSNSAGALAIEAATRAAGLAVQVDDPDLRDKVATWKHTFDATPHGFKMNVFTGAPAGASDAEWQRFTDAYDAALAHLGTLTIQLTSTKRRR